MTITGMGMPMLTPHNVELGNIPLLDCYVRREFLFDGESHHGELERVITSTVSSVPGWAIAFNLQLLNGAQFARVPIHALVHKPDAPLRQHYDLQLWDCMGDVFSIYQSVIHDGCRVTVRIPTGEVLAGEYLWSIAWQHHTWWKVPDQHKYGHFIALDEGSYCLLPNNCVLRWDLPWFKDDAAIPAQDCGYKANSRVWSCECDRPRWKLQEDSFMYEVTNEN